MKRRRAPPHSSPLKQTTISSFFAKGSTTAKKVCTEKTEGSMASPDIILNTPPPKTSGRARKSLENHFKKSPKKLVETAVGKDDFDSAFFENTPPKCLLNPKGSDSTNKKNLESPLKSRNILKDLNFDDFSSDYWDIESSSSSQKFTLGFETCLKCVVVSTELVNQGAQYEKKVVVRQTSGDELGCIVLRDMWANFELCAGDAVGIEAVLSDDWVVNAQQGYISLYPDTLVSSTSLVGALFCQRRGVLSNIFKGLDAENRVMTVGSLAHEMFQKALENPECTKSTLDKIIQNLLEIPGNLRMLYASGVSLEDVKKELSHFKPFVVNFVNTYVKKLVTPKENNFSGVITDIVDIEEQVSSVNVGLKGRIDVTVNVQVDGRSKPMPLELKTGRASFSNEHRSQVILYVIMMSDMGLPVDSGLLMYLREGCLREVKPTRAEIRDLILLRNHLVGYLRRFEPSNLPEPIRMASACAKCPYNNVCTAYLNKSVSQNHPIRSVGTHFDEKHLEYFLEWSKLLLLEDDEANQNTSDTKLTGLVLEQGVVRLKNQFKYSFKRGEQDTKLSAGNFVSICASGGKMYTGRIIQVATQKCSVTLDKELAEPPGSDFTISGYQSSFLSRYMSNLGCLMDQRNLHLRQIIVDLEPPKFAEAIPKSLLSDTCLQILTDLNSDQQRAVLKMLAAQNYLLVEGPPGTGKTQTIVAMVKVLIALKQTVLLVSHTHSSVDNILLRLGDVEFLRMGGLISINEKLHDKSYVKLSENIKSVTEIEALFGRTVLASTCLGLDADIVGKKQFDVCIVDESSQVLQPEVLKPLFAAKKFVLIGDSKQLGPVVKCRQAKKMGMSRSIFERLASTESVVTLSYQYRMNAKIMEVANNLTYKGILRAGNDTVLNGVLQLNQKSRSTWMEVITSPLLEQAVVFVDTSEYLSLNPGQQFSCVNKVEAKLVVLLVEEFLHRGLSGSDIGVIAPFRDQTQLLRETSPKDVEVNTVDQYQGRDKECVLFSCTKQGRREKDGFVRGENELLNDERRLNVALTRAKYKLVIVGDKSTLSEYTTFQRLFKFMSPTNIVTLKESSNGFSWDLLTIS